MSLHPDKEYTVMEKFAGTFEISPDAISLSLPDGRRFTLVFHENKLVIHDVSWNQYFTGERTTLTRDAILAIQHSEIETGPSTILSVMKFMDNTPVPPAKPV